MGGGALQARRGGRGGRHPRLQPRHGRPRPHAGRRRRHAAAASSSPPASRGASAPRSRPGVWKLYCSLFAGTPVVARGARDGGPRAGEEGHLGAAHRAVGAPDPSDRGAHQGADRRREDHRDGAPGGHPERGPQHGRAAEAGADAPERRRGRAASPRPSARSRTDSGVSVIASSGTAAPSENATADDQAAWRGRASASSSMPSSSRACTARVSPARQLLGDLPGQVRAEPAPDVDRRQLGQLALGVGLPARASPAAGRPARRRAAS